MVATELEGSVLFIASRWRCSVFRHFWYFPCSQSIPCENSFSPTFFSKVQGSGTVVCAWKGKCVFCGRFLAYSSWGHWKANGSPKREINLKGHSSCQLPREWKGSVENSHFLHSQGIYSLGSHIMDSLFTQAAHKDQLQGCRCFANGGPLQAVASTLHGRVDIINCWALGMNSSSLLGFVVFYQTQYGGGGKNRECLQRWNGSCLNFPLLLVLLLSSPPPPPIIYRLASLIYEPGNLLEGSDRVGEVELRKELSTPTCLQIFP